MEKTLKTLVSWDILKLICDSLEWLFEKTHLGQDLHLIRFHSNVTFTASN